MKFKSKIIILATTVFLLFAGIGVSSYIIKNNETIDNSSEIVPPSNTNEVTVQIGRKYYIDYKETETNRKYVLESENGLTVNNETSFNNIANFLINNSADHGSVGDEIPSFSNAKLLESSTYYDPDDPKKFTHISMEVDGDISGEYKVTKKSSGCGGTYSGEKVKIYVTKNEIQRDESIVSDNMQVYKIPYNSSLPEQIINEYLPSSYEGENYAFANFVETDGTNQPSNIIFNIEKSITTNLTLYAVYHHTSNDTGKINITNKINALGSGSYSIYKGATLDVSKDYSYTGNTTKSFSLGYKNTTTTINSGVTVNFAMNNGNVRVNNLKNSNKVSLEPKINSLQYKIVLQNDLYVDGTMNIAGYFGSGSNNGIQGNLAGDDTTGNGYVHLDLNGHNIHISSSGVLNCYGIITDYRGTGNIYVNGGVLTTLLIINDYKGGTSSKNAISANVAPFILFNVPYLRCNVIVKYSENTWGRLVGVSCVKYASYFGPTEIAIDFCGNYNGDKTYFFGLETPSDPNNSYIEFTFYRDNSFGNITDKNFYKEGYDIRLNWKFYNINVHVQSLTMNISVEIDTSTFIFPIPSFFDMELYSSTFEFSNRLLFLPGVKFFGDEFSTVCFSYTGTTVNDTASLFVAGDAPFFYEKGKFNTKSYLSAASNSHSSGYFWIDTAVGFWKYYQKPLINILGTILFKTGNTQPYHFYGNVNFNKIGYYGNDRNDFDLATEENHFNDLIDNGVSLVLQGCVYIPLFYNDTTQNLKIYGSTLVSHGVAYFSNGTSITTGLYDDESKIITSNGQQYFVYADTTSNSYHNRNDNVVLKSITTHNKDLNYVVDYSSGKAQYYVRFAGLYLLCGKTGETAPTADNTVTVDLSRWHNTKDAVTLTYNATNKYWTSN